MAAETKMFEVRDEGTTMVVLALKPDPRFEAERWGWAKSGYGTDPIGQRHYVLLAPLHAGEGLLVCDPFKHPGQARTLPTAHKHIIENWDYLRSMDVIDVQFILGETTVAKVSERDR
jgi:hypothetical protein